MQYEFLNILAHLHSNEIANGFRAQTLRCFLKRIELYRGLELLEPCPHLELLALGGKHRRPQIEGLLTNICQTRKGKYDEHSVTAGFNFSECPRQFQFGSFQRNPKRKLNSRDSLTQKRSFAQTLGSRMYLSQLKFVLA